MRPLAFQILQWSHHLAAQVLLAYQVGPASAAQSLTEQQNGEAQTLSEIVTKRTGRALPNLQSSPTLMVGISDSKPKVESTRILLGL